MTKLQAAAQATSLAMLVALGACSSTPATAPPTPAQSVFQAGLDYRVATAAILIYEALPLCPAIPVCKKPGVVDELKKADAVAYAALTQAHSVVIDPTKTATAVGASVAALQSGVVVLQEIIKQYSLTPGA